MLPNVSSLLDHPLCERIPALQPSHFYPYPPDMTASKVCKDLIGIVSTKFMVYFGEELATFSHVVDSFPMEI